MTVLKYILFVLILAVPAFSAGTPLTEETGREMLKELQSIRQLLEKQQKPATTAPPVKAESQTVKVAVAGGSSLGRADAPLVLIEYTDYQCPYCKKFYEGTFQEIKKNYIDTGKVRFISRNLPLPFHNHAQKAAQAAYCGGVQGKYAEMKGLLFAAKKGLDPAVFKDYAAEAGLDGQLFQACLDGDESLKAINAEAKYAATLGITGTPSFLVGLNSGAEITGKKIVGGQPYASFSNIFDELLKSPPAKR